MGFMYFFVLFMPFVNLTFGNYEPSFRSSVNKNGKPILRLGPDTPNPVLVSETLDDPVWVSNLRSHISQMVALHGFEGSKNHIRDYVNGQSDVIYRPFDPILRSPKPGYAPSEPPQWLNDYKSTVLSLVKRYGEEGALYFIQLLTERTEEQHNVYISDVNDEVVVQYTKDKKRQIPNFDIVEHVPPTHKPPSDKD